MSTLRTFGTLVAVLVLIVSAIIGVALPQSLTGIDPALIGIIVGLVISIASGVLIYRSLGGGGGGSIIGSIASVFGGLGGGGATSLAVFKLNLVAGAILLGIFGGIVRFFFEDLTEVGLASVGFGGVNYGILYLFEISLSVLVFLVSISIMYKYKGSWDRARVIGYTLPTLMIVGVGALFLGASFFGTLPRTGLYGGGEGVVGMYALFILNDLIDGLRRTYA